MQVELIYESRLTKCLHYEQLCIKIISDAERIMSALTEHIAKRYPYITIVINDKLERIPVLTWLKIENRLELFNLVGIQLPD